MTANCLSYIDRHGTAFRSRIQANNNDPMLTITYTSVNRNRQKKGRTAVMCRILLSPALWNYLSRHLKYARYGSLLSLVPAFSLSFYFLSNFTRTLVFSFFFFIADYVATVKHARRVIVPVQLCRSFCSASGRRDTQAMHSLSKKREHKGEGPRDP